VLFFAVRIVHLLAMVVWLGTGLSVPSIADIERTLALPPDHHRPLLDRLRLTTLIVVPSAVTTVITGVVLMQLRGGPSEVSWRYPVALGLSIVTFLIGGLFSQKGLDALKKGIEAGDDEAAKAGGRRFKRAVRVEDLLRLAIFFLMVIPL
jgi:uncharacterized membrane protein